MPASNRPKRQKRTWGGRRVGAGRKPDPVARELSQERLTAFVSSAQRAAIDALRARTALTYGQLFWRLVRAATAAYEATGEDLPGLIGEDD